MEDLLEKFGCEVVGLNLKASGEFPRPPEPIPEHLRELCGMVMQNKVKKKKKIVRFSNFLG